MNAPAHPRRAQLQWLEGLKAFAILGILLNHLVEEFGPGPWFTNPNGRWAPLGERLRTLYPADDQPLVGLVRFFGWLGDAGPGVFIFASGLGLTLAVMPAGGALGSLKSFYARRAERLYPLYLAMHAVILGLALLIPAAGLSMASTTTLQSLMGLRFTGETFFAISPSWWFVWLILQLYAVFPLLFWALRRLGPLRFTVLAVALTIASRAAGMVVADQLYLWMTGQFFGSRLAEFALGMVAGQALASGALSADRPLDPGKAAAIGLSAYITGFAASLLLPTTVISNLLVTVGWLGIGYAAWSLVSKWPAARSTVLWIGGASFAVFLLHQPLLDWTSVVFPGATSAHLLAAVSVLALSFPAGRIVERAVERATRRRGSERDVPTLTVSALLVALLAIGHPLALEHGGGDAWAWAVGVSILLLVLTEWRRSPAEPGWQRTLRWSVAGAAVAQLWFEPNGVPYLGVIAGGITGAVAGTLQARGWRPALSLPVGATAGIAGLLALEFAVRRVAPAEAGGWGELPALVEHPRWTYALKPDAITRLRYNQYDYVVRSNQLGLPGPDPGAGAPPEGTLRVLVTGDAFTMPEGLSYEQGYPALLQQSLRACLSHPVDVVDAGITGYGPVESSAQLADLVPMLRPRIVLYQFFVNEFSEVNATRDQRLENIGLRAPQSIRQRVLSKLQLAVRLRDAGNRVDQALTGHRAPDPYWSSVVRFYQRQDGPWYADSTLAKVRDRLAAMRDVAAGEGAWFGIVFVPAALSVRPISEVAFAPAGTDPARDFDLSRPWRHLSAIAESLRIPVLDPSNALKRSPPGVYHPAGWHWTSLGHEVTSRAIVEWLAGERLVSGACAPGRVPSS